MQFLMADGSVHELVDVISAEVQDGRLVCLDSAGMVVTTFERLEVIAYGMSLATTLNGDAARRKNRDQD
jgi:hypothetical protein